MLMKLGAGFLAVSVGFSIPAAVVVHQHGFAVVEVHEKQAGGENLYIPVPMALVNLALHFVPREHLREAGRQVRDYHELVTAVAGVLAECPDGVFVSVEEDDETVLVEKRDGNLEVHVDNRQETVHVSVPLYGAALVVQQLAEAAD